MKRITKMLGGLLASATLALGLVACGGAQSTSASSSDASGSTYKIGVIQLVEHNALDQANKGFVDALNESGISYEIDQQNAQGDQSACQTIASKLVGDNDDLILAIATPAAQAIAGATTEIPIVGTAITDFADSGLVASNEAPGGNVTGSSDLTPVADQIKMLHTILPDAKNVGVLYCSAESNSTLQAEMAKKACEENGLTATNYTVSNSNEIQSVIESMVGKVDAIYTPTDNVIAAGMTTVAMVADENKIPVICGEESMVDNGGLCTYSINYYELGKLAGNMAVSILKDGKKPAEMPIEYYPSDKLTFKGDADKAKALGIDMSLWETIAKDPTTK
ncbi:MAG: ABC transporter substrate-binding protein [Coriobacteriales bacterium]|nr:ABC transporter substrate-binding protein [Coriobacteriales bacterium]